MPWDSERVTEANSVRTLLVEFGVPDSAISLEGYSRNTRENAVNSLQLMEELECKTTLLITSAAHMQRSLAAFESIGAKVFPVSTDIRAISNNDWAVQNFLPQAAALAMTSDAMHEWMGRQVYTWRGWN